MAKRTNSLDRANNLEVGQGEEASLVEKCLDDCPNDPTTKIVEIDLEIYMDQTTL